MDRGNAAQTTAAVASHDWRDVRNSDEPSETPPKSLGLAEVQLAQSSTTVRVGDTRDVQNLAPPSVIGARGPTRHSSDQLAATRRVIVHTGIDHPSYSGRRSNGTTSNASSDGHRARIPVDATPKRRICARTLAI